MLDPANRSNGSDKAIADDFRALIACDAAADAVITYPANRSRSGVGYKARKLARARVRPFLGFLPDQDPDAVLERVGDLAAAFAVDMLDQFRSV